jgi:hypothetical protein
MGTFAKFNSPISSLLISSCTLPETEPSKISLGAPLGDPVSPTCGGVVMIGAPEGLLDGALLEEGNADGAVDGEAETLGAPLG